MHYNSSFVHIEKIMLLLKLKLLLLSLMSLQVNSYLNTATCRDCHHYAQRQQQQQQQHNTNYNHNAARLPRLLMSSNGNDDTLLEQMRKTLGEKEDIFAETEKESRQALQGLRDLDR